jgi:hypothetical protein
MRDIRKSKSLAQLLTPARKIHFRTSSLLEKTSMFRVYHASSLRAKRKEKKERNRQKGKKKE